ncbi:sensor histidine kinase [Pseudoduganella eburnea]|uniref:Sensor histidine kinase n=1 Tax=Massilia eburnea TaxID=1776165 RepID=A0A6L6QH31_9BURK|nr:ATP-binding protein [Massilia eburnea]MTW11549.1 sensor histidine kinase [Massilia eburnea]
MRASWRIGTRGRLLAITLLPVLALFVTLTWYNYQSRQSEVHAELAERGRLLATALVASSEISLVQGQFDELRATINGMLQTDSAVHRVSLLDASRKPLLDVEGRGDAQPEARYYEAAIHKRLLYITGGGNRNVGTMGYVQVRMSPTAMLSKARARFQLELAVALAGLLVCAGLAWRMTSGFADSLQASMQAVRAADAEKRRLLQRVTTAVEDERKAIALEIHDELNATLIAVRLEAQLIAALASGAAVMDGEGAGAPGGDTAAQIRDKAQAIVKLALGLYNSGRTLVRRLRPEMLDMLGLQGALEEMVRQVGSSHPSCRFSLHTEGDFTGLDGDAAISAYRIVQESLSNVVKHARAGTASVEVARRGHALHITVADDGIGFDPARTAAGVGLAGMRERVQALGGGFAMDCVSGTRIAITLPVEAWRAGT